MLTVDRRCFCMSCESRTQNIYRMVGDCTNCGQRDILILFRAGDEKSNADCPVCGCWLSVAPSRLATPDEIPAAEPEEADQR